MLPFVGGDVSAWSAAVSFAAWVGTAATAAEKQSERLQCEARRHEGSRVVRGRQR